MTNLSLLKKEVKYNSNSKDNPLIPFYTSVQWNMFGSHIPYLPAKQRIIHWKMPRLQRMTDCRAFPWFLEDSVTKDMGVVEYSRLFNYLGRNWGKVLSGGSWVGLLCQENLLWPGAWVGGLTFASYSLRLVNFYIYLIICILYFSI